MEKKSSNDSDRLVKYLARFWRIFDDVRMRNAAIENGEHKQRNVAGGLALAYRCSLSSRCSQGGVEFPTGGIGSDPGARERFRLQPKGQQIRCEAGADGIVRMEESIADRAFRPEGAGSLFAQGKIVRFIDRMSGIKLAGEPARPLKGLKI